MVLGPSAKNRKEASIHVNYQIRIQEIKPWPPSQSLRSLRSVMIQWQIGDRSSGFTKTVVPSLGAVIGGGKIEFNESFRLPVTLLRDMNVKNKDADTFLKNCLEFNLYEPRREKNQLLATATIDLADYGIVKEIRNVNAPMNCKRSFSNAAQPVLFIRIQPVEKAVSRRRSSLRDGFSKEASLDKKSGESVSDLMNEEYSEEADIASFTDDDVSSHSSLTVSSSATESHNGLASQNGEIGSVALSNSTESLKKERDLASKFYSEKSNMKPLISPHENLKGRSSRSSSISSDLEGTENDHASVSNTPNSSAVVSNKGLANIVQSSSSSFNNENAEEEDGTYLRGNDHEYSSEVQKYPNGKSAINGDVLKNSEEGAANHFPPNIASLNDKHFLIEKIGFTNSWDSQVKGENDGSSKTWRTGKGSMEDAANSDDNGNSFMEDKERKEQDDDGLERENSEEKGHFTGDKALNIYLRDDIRNQVSFGSDSPSPSREDLGYLGMKVNILKSDRLKHVKSVRSSSDIARNNVHQKEVDENGVSGDVRSIGGSFKSSGRKDTKVYPKDARSSIVDSKIQRLEHKVKILEEELREAASTEAALYSVVAEHGSSMSKVHAPARRLSRLYLHACKESSQSGRASAARSAVSGLVLVAKACGNDVPRLTFWLSNSVVLRVIISQATGALERPFSACQRGNKKISSPLKWKEPSPHKKENRNVMNGSFGDWKDPCTLSSALEKVEAWIFSRIIESVWWQTLTPHMQSAAEKVMDRGISSGSRKHFGRTSSSADQDQVNFSLDHWKKAFKDACERLCPVRAGGHECGCLRLLASLVMEQCVARLDVAMFNAILRESADEIPTDPVSDPISDPTVLPIPAGKSSFGAGAQLKNAIGNWSRWLSDLFGMDYDDSLADENELDDIDGRQDSSFNSFHLLNALSDLMILPKDMLLSQSIRKEVCPSFGASLIKRVLHTFVPDEFCPEPIQDVVLEALDSEDPLEAGEESVASFPCIAAPSLYSPPSAAFVASVIGEFGSHSQLRRSGSSVVRKSYTSDDELDELNSPLASIFIDGSRSSPVPTKLSWMSKKTSNQNTVRYELLRDIWMNSE